MVRENLQSTGTFKTTGCVHMWRPRSKMNSISVLVTDASGIVRNAAIFAILREK